MSVVDEAAKLSRNICELKQNFKENYYAAETEPKKLLEKSN